MTFKQSFAPIINEQSEILVLGSMPGEASLAQQAYYAHPQNLFWKIPAECLRQELPTAYDDRLALLTHFRVALWDVLQYCQREGSLDSKIIRSSEQANDIASLLSQYPNIRKLCFNGQKAFQAFKRHCLKAQPDTFRLYETVVLPSTSPANASIPKSEKYQRWQEAVWMVRT